MHNLVEYSSSDEEVDKILPKLELPDELSFMSSDLIRFVDHKDDPSLHEFRSRSFKHESGMWASAVYIDCKLVILIILGSFLCVLVTELFSYLLTINGLNLKFYTIKDPHISLSKTWTIYHHWIQNLSEKLKTTLSLQEKC